MTIILFNYINTEDIYIEDDLFDKADTEDIKDTSKDTIETIYIDDDIDIPSDDGIAIDAPKKPKIITDTNRIRLAPNKIKKKYQKQRRKGPPEKDK